MPWLEDPFTEHEALAAVQLRQDRLRRFQAVINESVAADIAYGSTINPTAHPALITGAVMSGMPTDDEMFAEATALQAESEASGAGGWFGEVFANIGDAVRGATRWLALGFDGVMDEMIDRPLRTAANMIGGDDIGEAYANSGDAPFGAFGEALGQINPFQAGGTKGLNLGTGFLPNSQLAVPVTEALGQLRNDARLIEEGNPMQRAEIYERYANEYGFRGLEFLPPAQQSMMLQSQVEERIMEMASDPSDTRFGVHQAQYGRPVTQRQMAEKNAVIVDMNSLGTSGPNYQQVSLGRVFAGLVTESGTKPFHYLSGGIDFAKQVGMDPTAVAGGWVAKVSKARKAIGVGTEGAAAIADANKVADEVTGLIKQVDELGLDPNVSRYQGWTTQTQRRADEAARLGIQPEQVAAGEASARLYKYQTAGQKAAELHRAKARLAELVNDPDFIRIQNYADVTTDRLSVLDTLTDAERHGVFKRNQRIIPQYKAHQRALQVREEIVRVGQQVEELRNSDEVRRFESWSPRTKDQALELAAKADVDPTLKPRLAEQQRVARAALTRMDEAAELTKSAEALEEAATLGYQIKAKAGILEGIRPDVDPSQVTQFVTGRSAARWIDELAGADAKRVDELLEHIPTSVPRALREDLTKATDRASVIEVLLPYLTKGEIGYASRVPGKMSRLGKAMATPVTRLHAVHSERVAAKLASKGGYDYRPLYGHSRLQRMFSEMSPRALDLNDLDSAYEGMISYARNIGWERGDEILEGHLEAFRNLADGDFNSAYGLLADFRTDAISRLTTHGLDKKVAEAVTNWINVDKSQFLSFLDDAGRLMDDAILTLDGEAIPLGQPHLWAELFKGVVHMPDARLVRHAAAELDGIGKMMNRVATKGADQMFDQRAMFRWTNSVMTRYWKPMVLLRVAWPVRVIGEEQVRMLAGGITQPFQHPIHNISRLFYDKKMADVLGDSMTHSEVFGRAKAGRAQFQGDFQAKGIGAWRRISRKQDPYSHYRDAALNELNQLWSDPVVGHLFRVADAGTDLSHADRIAETVEWLLRGQGSKFLDDLVQNASADARKALSRTEGVTQYVSSVYARAHQKAGGRWEIVRPDGRIIPMDGSSATKVLGEGEIPPLYPLYRVVEPGIDELVESFGTKQWRGMQVANRFVETDEAMKAIPDAVHIRQVRAELDNLLATKAGERMPEWYKGVSRPSAADEKKWDQGVNFMFDLLMSKPTNRLSRSPAFREYYWRHLGEIAPYMDDATLAAARKGADVAKYRKQFDAAMDERIAGLGRPVDDAARDLTSLSEADGLAKAQALTQVQDLLFDVSKRSNAADALSIIAPFADAWYEVISTWARLMKQKNVVPARRLQQVVESARESNITDPRSGYSNEGFLREVDGREVFTIPYVNDLWQKLSGHEADFAMSPGQLSMMTDVLPALGPVASFAVQPIIPEEPGWDWLRGYTAPMGNNRSLVQSFVPAYMQRVLGAIDFTRNLVRDPELIRLYNNSVKDVLNQMARNDPEFFEANRNNPDRLLEAARGKASQLWWVQALARFVGPAAPSTIPTAEDSTGFVWHTSVLQDEYYNMLERHQGDTIAASEEFISKFGLEPFTVTGADTAEIEKRSSTRIGYNFKRMNEELFERYPHIAYYLGPSHLEDYAEFDYEAYHAQLAEMARVSLTPDQFLMMMNDTKGRLAYAKARQDIELQYGRGLSDPGWTGEMALVKEELEDNLRSLDSALRLEYNGYAGAAYGSEVAGMPARVDTDQQIAQIRKAIAENPDLVASNPALGAAAEYLAAFDMLAQGANVSGKGELADSGEGNPLHPNWQRRMDLRRLAAVLIQSTPEFGPMWEDIFGRQLVDDLDDELTIEDAYEVIAGG